MLSHSHEFRNLDIGPVLGKDVCMTKTAQSSSLDHRAILLEELLFEDGIIITLEEARDLIIAEAVERILARSVDETPVVQ